jgi:glycosyltransferase involved in cell wall biosynthesis
MRIAQIVASLEARHGGPSRSVLGLAKGLAANGHEIEVLTTEPGPSQVQVLPPGLTVRRFPRDWPQALAPSKGLKAHLESQAFEVIHAHGLWLRPLHYAHGAARLAGAPLVISPRGMMSPWAWQHRRLRKRIGNGFVHPRALQAAAGWHATSELEADDIRRLGFTQPICVAANGVDVPAAEELGMARAHWLARCPALAGHRVALFYSRFHPKKRILELIDLWANVAPPDWMLLLVGIPEAYSVAALRDYADRTLARDRVAVFDGTDAPAPYAVASVYLLPSHSENFGLTIAEALASGLPVVTTDATPWAGLHREDAGRCVPWDEFGPAMLGLLREPAGALIERGRRGRRWMEAEFSWATAAARLVDHYAALRGSPR